MNFNDAKDLAEKIGEELAQQGFSGYFVAPGPNADNTAATIHFSYPDDATADAFKQALAQYANGRLTEEDVIYDELSGPITIHSPGTPDDPPKFAP